VVMSPGGDQRLGVPGHMKQPAAGARRSPFRGAPSVRIRADYDWTIGTHSPRGAKV